MEAPVTFRLLFTMTFPSLGGRDHIPLVKLHSLARKQLPDMDVIESIDHLFKCNRCFENYRRVLKAHSAPTLS